MIAPVLEPAFEHHEVPVGKSPISLCVMLIQLTSQLNQGNRRWWVWICEMNSSSVESDQAPCQAILPIGNVISANTLTNVGFCGSSLMLKVAICLRMEWIN